MLSVGSAAVPYRLILPLSEGFEYRFTHLEQDPYELSPLTAWDLDSLAAHVASHHGLNASDWLVKAEGMGSWWIDERKRLWNYHE